MLKEHKNLPATVVMALLSIVGILGYTAFSTKGEPTKVVFMSKGGAVVFPHAFHSSPDDVGMDCSDCHHKFEEPEEGQSLHHQDMKCNRCHRENKEVSEKECPDRTVHTWCASIGGHCMECHEGENCGYCHRGH